MTLWPYDSGVRVGVFGVLGGNPTPSMQRVSQVYPTSPAGEEAYVSANVSLVLAQKPTTDTSGSLRLTRIGSLFTGYYLDTGGSWVQMGSAIGPTADMPLYFMAWSHDQFFGDQNVEVTLSNPRIEAVPEPPAFIVSGALLLPLLFHRIRRVTGAGARRDTKI